MYQEDTYFTDEAPRPRRKISFVWPALLLIALALYELTNQPALAVIALCTQFGLEDVRTAFWLRKRAPSGGRGWASFFLYFACGLWKMAITATLMIFAYIILLIIHAAAGGQGLDLRTIGLQMAGAILVTLG